MVLLPLLLFHSVFPNTGSTKGKMYRRNHKRKSNDGKTGQAILHHAFPTWISPSFLETYFLTCLLHDLGATPSNQTATLLSFEFYGAMLSHTLLLSHQSPVPQAGM
jgi:hypothetical protein